MVLNWNDVAPDFVGDFLYLSPLMHNGWNYKDATNPKHEPHHDGGNSSCFPPHQQLVNGENQPIVINELAKFEKEPVEIQDFNKIYQSL